MSSRPRILISSSVYDKKALLTQVYSALEGIGYEVWMSDKGTIPLDSNLSTIENCLEAVKNCDLFLGIISGFYGTGIDGKDDSFTHQEITKAIELNKSRWFLVQSDVLLIRRFVKKINEYEKSSKNEVCSKLKLNKSDPISDMRIFTMYDEATRSDVDLSKRVGNWVQEYKSDHEVLQFIKAQFKEPK